MTAYHSQIEQLQLVLQKQLLQNRIISFFRFLAFLGFGFFIYKYATTFYWPFVLVGIFCFAIFLYLVTKHENLNWNINLTKNLLQINKDETRFLNTEETNFSNGEEYKDSTHLYCYDLDIFGTHSLFQHLNRTATHIGNTSLAKQLLHQKSIEEIIHTQQAVQELSKKLEWRQRLQALGKLTNDNKTKYEQLISWQQIEQNSLGKFQHLLLNILPVFFLLLVLLSFFNYIANPFFAITAAFVFNLQVTATQLKKIKKQLEAYDKVHDTLHGYGKILEHIENQDFAATQLQTLKKTISTNSKKASVLLKDLANAFSRLESFRNPLGAFLLNGMLLYHVRALKNVLDWKQKNIALLQPF